MWDACGPGVCDMDAATTADGQRIFAGGAEGMVKVRRGYGAKLLGCLYLYPQILLLCACALF